jgi:hypothetical protein
MAGNPRALTVDDDGALDLRRAPDGQSMPLCQDACAGCHTARVTPFSAPPLGQPRAGLFSDDRRWSAGCLSCWRRADSLDEAKTAFKAEYAKWQREVARLTPSGRPPSSA